MKMKNIHYLLFDLAGVVMNLNLERDTQALLAVGLPDFEGCLHNPGIKQAMLPYLNGLISQNEFLTNIRPYCRKDVAPTEILWAMDAVLDDIPEDRLQTLTNLRRQYPTYLLSNIYDSAWQHAVRSMQRHGYEPEECFDQLFLSYEMQLAKPDPRIFQAVIDATGLIPQQTLFLDDTQENVETARKLGFQAYTVQMNKLDDWLKCNFLD